MCVQRAGIDWEAAHEEAAKQATAAMSVPLVSSMQRPMHAPTPHAAVPPMWGGMPMRAPYGSGMPPAGFGFGYGAPYG